MDKGWTGGSRFWKITPYVVVLSAVLAMYFDDPTTFIAITAPWITVAGGKSMLSTHGKNGRVAPDPDVGLGQDAGPK